MDLGSAQPAANCENEVETASLTEGPVHVDAELGHGECNRDLGDVALLISRQHPRSVVATSEDVCCLNRLRCSGRHLA